MHRDLVPRVVMSRRQRAQGLGSHERVLIHRDLVLHAIMNRQRALDPLTGTWYGMR